MSATLTLQSQTVTPSSMTIIVNSNMGLTNKTLILRDNTLVTKATVNATGTGPFTFTGSDLASSTQYPGWTIFASTGGVNTYSVPTFTTSAAAGPTPPSAPISVTAAPTIVSGVPTSGSINVSWVVPASTGGATITNYRVTARVGGSDIGPISTGSSATSYTYTGLTNGAQYTFAVEAFNTAGWGTKSAYSTTPASPFTLPGAPTITAVDVSNQKLTITWTPPANAASVGLPISYKVSVDGTNWAQYGPGITSAVVSGLTNGTQYTVRVRGFVIYNGTQYDGSIDTSTATPRTTPSAPTGVSATAGDAQVTVTWNAPESTGGSIITGYKVYAYNGATLVAGGPMTIGNTTLSYTYVGLSNGTAYTFKVSAVNDADEGAQSTASSSVTPVASGGGEPGAPCFFGNALVKTPSGYRRMNSLVAGDMVLTPAGVPVAIERVKKYAVAAGPTTNPYVIPAGQFGATKRVVISPDHKVCLTDGRRIEAKRLGLAQEERDGVLIYYNLELTGEADMVVSGVSVESLAHVRRVVVTMEQFVAMAAHKYGAEALNPTVLAKLKRTCRMMTNNRIEVPVVYR
jgi:hypothetical protein